MAKHGAITRCIVEEIMKAGSDGTHIDVVTKKVARRVKVQTQKLRNNFDVCVNNLVKKGVCARYATNSVRVITNLQ